jgi:hypothetical protein
MTYLPYALHWLKLSEFATVPKMKDRQNKFCVFIINAITYIVHILVIWHYTFFKFKPYHTICKVPKHAVVDNKRSLSVTCLLGDRSQISKRALTKLGFCFYRSDQDKTWLNLIIAGSITQIYSKYLKTFFGMPIIPL